MLLVIDVGNTNHVFAVFEGKNLLKSWRLSTEAKRTADEYAFILHYFLQTQAIDFKRISDVVISNVVPQTEYAFRQLCQDYLHCKPFVVGSEGVDLGIKVKVDTPSEVGSDRLVNALAAYRRFKTACIVVDFGTATNFDIINKQGHYQGGVIAPGIHLSLDALHKATAKLPRVQITKPKKVVGTSTVPAIQSGIYFGYISMIEGMVARISQECKTNFKVIGTGGLAALLAKGTDIFDLIDPDLTIYGLKEVYELNKKS